MATPTANPPTLADALERLEAAEARLKLARLDADKIRDEVRPLYRTKIENIFKPYVDKYGLAKSVVFFCSPGKFPTMMMEVACPEPVSVYDIENLRLVFPDLTEEDHAELKNPLGELYHEICATGANSAEPLMASFWLFDHETPDT